VAKVLIAEDDNTSRLWCDWGDRWCWSIQVCSKGV